MATYDAGAVRYFGHRRVLDLVGLNSHEVLDDPNGAIFRLRPGYVVLPHRPGEPEGPTETWRAFRLGGGLVYLRPLFSAAARNYTITTAFPNRQTVYEISYSAPGGQQLR